MRIYCQRHKALLSPEPSGYFPTATWYCPTEPRERLGIGHLLASGISPLDPNIAGVAVVTSRNTTRLIAFETIEASRA